MGECLQATLDLASLFALHQCGLPVGSAPYAPTREGDLGSSVLRILSILKTASKIIPAIKPEVLASQDIDVAWSRLYRNVWALISSETAGNNLGGLGNLTPPQCLLVQLEMLPSLAAMLAKRETCIAADASPNMASLSSQTASARTSSRVLLMVMSHLNVYNHMMAFASPTLSLSVLMSQPALSILEAVGRSIASSKEMPPLPMVDNDTPSPRDMVHVAPDSPKVGVTIALSALLTCSVDQIFCLDTALPSTLESRWGNAVSSACFIANLHRQVTSTLMLLSAVYRKRCDPLQAACGFLSSYTEAASALYHEPLLLATSEEASKGPLLSGLDCLSALSRILSSPVWDALLDCFPEHETVDLCFVVSVLTISLFQSVAIVEKRLMPSLSSGSSAEVDKRAVDDAYIEQQWRDCKANIVEALLHCSLPEDKGSGSFLNPPFASEVALGNVVRPTGSWPSVLPLLRSSLAQLRMVVKSCNVSHFVPKNWELIKAELHPEQAEIIWGVSSCCNTACTRLEGPCEVEVKTLACGGMCGARYCCRACQEQAWRAGH